MPFLTTIRYSEFGLDSKGNSRLQITDLFPNKSQSNAVITPRFQGPYNFRPLDLSEGNAIEVLPALDGALDIAVEVSGLAAYFLAVVESNVAGTNIDPAVARAIAGDVIAHMQFGIPLRLAEINAMIGNNVNDATSDLDGSAVGSTSTGSVKEVLEILCGAKTFTLPAGHSIGDVGNGNAFTPFANAQAQASAFTAIDGYTSIPSTHDSFYLSARSGQIKRAQLLLNTNNQPVLVAYDDDGSVVK